MTSGGGSSAFNPMSVSGMAAWWAARLETGFANNDPVGTVVDQTGNGLTLTQATASKKPLYATNVKNGLPAFVSDGVDDFLTGGNILNVGSGSLHFFFVAKLDSSSGVKNYFAKYSSGAAGQYSIYHQGAGSGNTRQLESYYMDGTGAYNAFSNSGIDTNWHLLEFVVDRSTNQTEIFRDGVSIGTAGGIDAGTYNPTNRFLMFAGANGTDTGEQFFLQGKIAEMWCWQRVLTANERTTLRAGANELYAIY